jgi:UDP-N-acetyl-D-glucosamine dehydrogenase
VPGIGEPRTFVTGTFDVCVVGLGYVGLPTALSLTRQGRRVLGLDVNERRLAAIRLGDVDILAADREPLESAFDSNLLQLSGDPARLSSANTVVICVPTPVDRHQVPDLAPLRAACDVVVSHARAGQTLILTSTSYVGTTRDLLVEPLRRRGLEPGRDVYVAFSPERIDPGRADHAQDRVPRVIGGINAESADRAREVLATIAPAVHVVSSAEAAELTKLYENTFRAVNIAFALEMSQAATALGLSVLEVIGAAATKPYGFMAFYPGPGVGGHCIPCDPHYLLWQLRTQRVELPLIDRAMTTIAGRPRIVAQRLRDLLADRGRSMRGARILIAGVTYKSGIQDTRESPAIALTKDLLALDADVEIWDPVADCLDLGDGRVLRTVENPAGADFDAVVVHTLHAGHDYGWLDGCATVLDATYQLDSVVDRAVV